MQINKIAAAFLLVSFGMSVMAEERATKGEVNFSGTIQSSTCSIAGTDVNFGTFERKNFAHQEAQGFVVNITDCIASDIKEIKITGNQADKHLASTGAKNVGIDVTYEQDASPINFVTGKSIKGEGIKVGAHNFSAKLVKVQESQEVGLGAISAKMTVTVTYN